ncbi:hypothetical protein BDA99DRAFT_534437 [Phascolomyces articulosus]|uniref:Uncharacterized protein n=1 Tax=Phascolomyces articulosus TaxID=60185 RepID=A0AAD5K566_9FUNG|nr:hypothetical protein BDA99DRAFT_534437 [Phascolomyces articulosus]
MDALQHPESNQQQYRDNNPGAALISWIDPPNSEQNEMPYQAIDLRRHNKRQNFNRIQSCLMNGPYNYTYPVVISLFCNIANLPEQRMITIVKNGQTRYSYPGCLVSTANFHLPCLCNNNSNNGMIDLIYVSQNDTETVKFDENEVAAVHTVTLWEKWISFLNTAAEDLELHEFSAERHGVTICGHGIRKRRKMDGQTYTKLCTKMCTQQKDDMNDAAKKIAFHNSSRSRQLIFYQICLFLSCVSRDPNISICSMRDLYRTNSDIRHSEAILQQPYSNILPWRRATKSMTTQLKVNEQYYDERLRYKADGVLRCCHSEIGYGIELTLLETNRAYDNATTIDLRVGIASSLQQSFLWLHPIQA